jgi:AcrR family transcriptional regulator
MMRVPARPVKARRRYDASGRRRAAARRRAAVLDAAARLFAAHGYAGTTIAAVAAAAGVSVETVYKRFGGKAGLVRALWERGLAGEGPEHAEWRSDRAASSVTDPRTLIRRWTELGAEVAPRAAPVLLMIRAAAGTDPEMARLRDRIHTERLERMEHNAGALAAHLRDGVTVAQARDVLVAYTTAELFESLVLHQGWSPEEFADFQRRGIEAQLL